MKLTRETLLQLKINKDQFNNCKILTTLIPDIIACLELLIVMAVNGTKISNLINKMLEFCLYAKPDKPYLKINQSLQDSSTLLTNHIMHNVISWNIPIAVSALAPCFLLELVPSSQELREELASILQQMAEDQAPGILHHMESNFDTSHRAIMAMLISN